jgi:hypothetical protein
VCFGERENISNATIMCVHAPTEENDYISKYSLSNKLATVYHTTSARYAKVLTGYINAKTGQEAICR